MLLPMVNAFQIFDSPVGNLMIVANEVHLTAVIFKNNRDRFQNMLKDARHRANNVILTKPKQKACYFEGHRKCFELTLSLCGTAFQKKAWKMLGQIPYGQTITYSQQTAKTSYPKAIRAVTSANATNPISVVIPCRRVIGKSGQLAGYGRGLHAKYLLIDLDLETNIGSIFEKTI